MKTIKHFISLAGLTGGLMTAAIPANILAQDAAVGESAKAADAQAPAAPAASQEQSAQPATSTNAAQDPTPQPATATTTQADTNTTSAQPTTTAAVQDASTNSTAEFSPDKGLRLNFRDVPLETVLNYMSKAAGYTIHPRVPISGRVNVWSDNPMSKDEAVDLLKHVLTDNGYTIIQDGRMLTIISSVEAKRNEIPVIKFKSIEDIPRNTDVATYVIPVHTLNPIALVKNLQPLTSSDTDLQANESANSLLLTDTQINVRRIAEIVTALDSVSSSINSIKVYPLKYADAKALSALIKELFPSAGAAGGGGGNNGGFGRFGGGGGGGRGGRGGGNAAGFPNFAQLFGGGGNQDPTGSTPSSRVAAVSDDHSNSLIISAPEELIATVDELIEKVDQPVEDITVVKMIHLKNADPGETADLLASLFPDDSASGNSSQLQIGNRGGGARGGARGGAAGGFGGFGGFGGRGGTTASSASSEYMKKMGRVAAVPDRRTQSLIISASKDLMPQIEEMISQLDEIDSNSMKVHVYSLKNADPVDVQTLLQDLFPSSTTSRSSSLQNNPLANRANTVLNNQMTTGAGSGVTTGFSSGGGGGGRTGF